MPGSGLVLARLCQTFAFSPKFFSLSSVGTRLEHLRSEPIVEDGVKYDSHLLIFAILSILTEFGVVMSTRYGVGVLGGIELNPISVALPSPALAIAFFPFWYLFILVVPIRWLRVKRLAMCVFWAWQTEDFAHDAIEILTANDVLANTFFVVILLSIPLVYLGLLTRSG